jgi:hypothetical protein
MAKKDEQNKLIVYQDENGLTRVLVRFADEDVWLTQNQIAEIYDTTQQNIQQHIGNIFDDDELPETATHKKFLLVQKEGTREVRRNISHYNLDMIIALGYRIQSQIATRFRQWATSVDYDPRTDLTKHFFATVQNKLHYAVHENTAAEVIYKRVDNEKPMVGMTNFRGDYITKDDVKIAKNYLTEIELKRLNLLVSQFLDFAEFQALEQNPMSMAEWVQALDNQIIAHKRKLLMDKGKISHEQAMKKAESEFLIYREREMKNLVSDFDRVIRDLLPGSNGETVQPKRKQTKKK